MTTGRYCDIGLSIDDRADLQDIGHYYVDGGGIFKSPGNCRSVIALDSWCFLS